MNSRKGRITDVVLNIPGPQYAYWNGKKTDQDTGRLSRICSMTPFIIFVNDSQGLDLPIQFDVLGVCSGILFEKPSTEVRNGFNVHILGIVFTKY